MRVFLVVALQTIVRALVGALLLNLAIETAVTSLKAK